MADSSVLVRLALLGAAAFRASAKEAGAGLKSLGDDSTVAGSRLKKFGAATEVAGGAIRGFATLAVPAVGFALVDATKKAVDFQGSMEQIHTQAGAAQSEVNKLSGQVLKLSHTTPQGPQALAQALYHLESVGLRGAKAMNALKIAAQGAAVGNANLEDTATALGSAWLVNIKGGGSLRHVMGLLNAAVGAGNIRMDELVQSLGTGVLPAAKQAGLGIKDILGALTVFTDEGYQGSSASAQLATALHFLYNPTMKASNALAAIGLPANALAIDMRKPQGLLVALKDLKSHLDTLPGGSKGVQSEQILGQILPGGRGRIILTLLNQLNRYQMKLGQISKTSSKFGSAVAAAQETATNRIKTAWSSTQAVMIQVGNRLLPFAANAASATATGLSQFATGLSTGRTTIRHQITPRDRELQGPGGVQSVTSAPFLQQAGADLSKGFKSTIQFLSKTALPAGKKAIGQFLAAIKPAEPFLANVLLPLLKGVGEGILVSIVSAFKVAIPIIHGVAVVLGAVGNVLKPFKTAITDIGRVVGFLLAGPILKMLGAIPKVGIVFKLLAAPIGIANKAVRGIGSVVSKAAGFFDDGLLAVSRFTGSFTGIGRKIVTPFLNGMRSVLNALTSIPGKFETFGGKIGSAIVSGIVKLIKAAPGSIVGALASIVPKPIRSLLSKAGGLAGKFANAINPVNLAKNLVSAKAVGGVVRTPLQIVGERGPELAALPRGSRVFTSAQTRQMLERRAGYDSPSMAHRRPMPTMAQSVVVLVKVMPQDVKVAGKTIHRVVYKTEQKVLAQK